MVLLAAWPLIAWAPPAFSGILFSEDFQSYPAGEKPRFDHVRPASNDDRLGLAVVDRDSARRSLRLWDYDDRAQAGIEHNFAAGAQAQHSAIRFDFSFQRSTELSTDGTLDSLYAMLGAFDEAETLGRQASRAFELRINNEGTFRINHGSGHHEAAYPADEVNTFSVFANSGAGSLFYEAPDGAVRQLSANSLDVYLNDALAGRGLAFLQQAFNDRDNILGKFGFRTGNANARENVDFLIDDIRVSVIPEAEPERPAPEVTRELLDERLPRWDAGVRGGIPDVPVGIALDAGDLAGDAAKRIQQAIDTVEAPGAVLLPEGEFRLTTPVRLRSGVVLRGMGQGKTRLHIDLAGKRDFDPNQRPAMGAIQFEGRRDEAPIALISGYERGSTTIRPESVDTFSVGDWVLVFSENDPELMYTDPRWERDWAQRLLAQIVRIERIAGGELNFDTPLRLTLKTELKPRVQRIAPIENAGLEDLTVERHDSLNDNIVGFEAAVNSWVRRCETIDATRSHVWINYSRFVTVESNHVHGAQHFGGGGQGYGIVTGNVAVDCLIQDNVLHRFRHSLMTKAGSNGNVFAYNYSFDRRREPEGAPLLCDISIHGHYSHHNLFEGNVVEHVVFADHWGPTGPRTTVFRNRVSDRIEVRDHSHDAIIAGNVVGRGIQSDGTSLRPLVFANFIEGDQSFNPDEAELLPDSLHLSRKPHFWPEDLAWPPVNPRDGSVVENLIPAQLRHRGSSGGTEAKRNLLRSADFSPLADFIALPDPWRTSDGDEGISVRIGRPPGAPAEERWIEFRDNSGPEPASASLRQQFEPVRNGRLSLRLHLAEDHEGEIGIYLGEGDASSSADRTIDMKTNQRGVLRVGSRGDRQNTPLLLRPGETHHLFLQFISANRDRFLLLVLGIYDEDGREEILARIEARHPPAPVSALRITTDNAPSGQHFYVTDLLLVEN